MVGEWETDFKANLESAQTYFTRSSLQFFSYPGGQVISIWFLPFFVCVCSTTGWSKEIPVRLPQSKTRKVNSGGIQVIESLGLS